MGLARVLTLAMALLVASVCTLGLHPRGPLARADDFTTGCPAEGNASAGCVCWSDGGVLKMMCNQPAAEGRDTGRESSRDGEGSTTGTSASGPHQAVTSLPAGEEPPKWMNAEERRAYFEQRQQSLDHSLLEVQRARFIARARNESPEQLNELDKAFKELKGSRQRNLDQLQAFGPSN